MPQNPLVPRYGGNASKLDISTPTVVKAAPGTLFRVSVTTAGSTTGAIYDAASGSGTAAQLVATIPETPGVYEFVWPCFSGILVVPGTAQVVSVSFA